MNRRIVLKVGTHVLSDDGVLSLERIGLLVDFVCELKAIGYEVILVSSGAVAAGFGLLPLDRANLTNRQILASLGQPLLLGHYQKLFAKHDVLASQMLLCGSIFENTQQVAHAKEAIEGMLSEGIVPVVNENDAVCVEELVFGDNDRLSAHVAHHFDAQMLVILSDIDALYDKDPHRCPDAKPRKIVETLSQEELEAEPNPNDTFATGGIVTKLQAANYLMDNNKQMFLASGFVLDDIRSFLVNQEHRGGTLFRAKGSV